MVMGAYIPSCLDHVVDEFGLGIQAHGCPREILEDDEGVVCQVL